MVQYLKTKRGYCYKLLKNNERKRISKEEYNKKNKTRKNKKMIGGGKTQEEIIDELIKNEKYDEWVRLGALFGQTSNKLKYKGMNFQTPFQYYNVNRDIVHVSMVSDIYKPDLDNIAVFEQTFVEDPNTYGGKTQEEIISELKKKGKYDEWVRLGSRFGQTSRTLKAKFFLVRPYQYYNVDGNIVHVSMVSTNYRPDVDNIAVFTQNVVEDPTRVNPSTYRIANITDKLFTTGLATCAGLAMIIGTKKFMTHVDTKTEISKMIAVIKKVITEEGIDPKMLIPRIYAGNLDSTITVQKAKVICIELGIPEENYVISNVCMTDRVEI